MNATLSHNSQDDLDQTMRLVARNVAMGIYDLGQILEMCAVSTQDFDHWKANPRFLAYVKAESEAWNSANNVGARTKLKAGFAMEEWILSAYGELTDKKTPLNQRVELGKLLAKIAGMDNSGTAGGAGSGDAGGFTLQINIGNIHRTFATETVSKVIDMEPEPEEDAPPARQRQMTALEAINSDLGIPE